MTFEAKARRNTIRLTLGLLGTSVVAAVIGIILEGPIFLVEPLPVPEGIARYLLSTMVAIATVLRGV